MRISELLHCRVEDESGARLGRVVGVHAQRRGEDGPHEIVALRVGSPIVCRLAPSRAAELPWGAVAEIDLDARVLRVGPGPQR